MNDKLIIPDNIKVGIRNRTDTYSNRLGFVIFRDGKGVLRQEKTWNGWRDMNIPAEDYDNEPMSGFVLNKDVGGSHRSYSWNARREKVRVYDPRDFEIEITVENLLFILQECSSIKGKGLEGKFVYAWSGSSLVLMPVTSEEYKNSMKFTDLQTESIGIKDLVAGCSYLTKDMEEVMYMGKYNWYDMKYPYNGKYSRTNQGQKTHLFYNLAYKKSEKDFHCCGGYRFFQKKDAKFLAKRMSEKPLDSYAQLFEELMKEEEMFPIVKLGIRDCVNPEARFREKNSFWNRNYGVFYDVETNCGEFYKVCYYECADRIEVMQHCFINDKNQFFDEKCSKPLSKSDIKCYGKMFAKLENGKTVDL